ncbi:sulfotransferase 1A1 [Aplysia californica]|uniref:Sulfotransferase 1A1 n=1 Tax=Aplysia californica TaxID=6500 RepID=A0ABM0K4B3_APLCA|nr:sulfotransferase 1A1 [Aplysia californica]
MSYLREDVLARGREVLKTVNNGLYDGVPYSRLDTVQDSDKMFEMIQNANLGEGDIMSSGFLRSGNHWVFEIVGHIMKQEMRDDRDDQMFRTLEFMGAEAESRINSLPSPKVITSHMRMTHLPKKIREGKVKLIYVMRNPKDAMTSWYRLLNETKIAADGFHGTWEEFLEVSYSGEIQWGSWFDHILTAEKFMQDYPDCPVHIVQYEMLKEDPVREIKALCEFLGRTDVDVEQLALATSFAKMKEKRGAAIQHTESLLKDGCAGMMVKGTIGGWRERFTVEQSERFDRIFDLKMAGSKLAERFRKYM